MSTKDPHVTRRSLLRLAGVSTMTAALAGAVRAEGGLATPTSTAAAPFATAAPISVGEAALRVRDLDAMIAYYRDAIGLSVIARDANSARMGSGGAVLLHLVAVPKASIEPRTHAGLFHIAFLMPSRAELARWLVHAAITRTPLTGFSDHGVSEAIYLDDPEGNGLEIYSDRPREQWQWKDGLVTMGTRQLDVDSILALADASRDTFERAPAGLVIGHIHLRVGDIATGRRFYQQALGLDSTRGERQDAAFVASGGYHHHIAINVWNSRGAGPRDKASTGLDWFSMRVRDAGILSGQLQRLRQAPGSVTEIANGLEATDPWGTTVRLLMA
jgi:catechol 2,3-dioxygenase